MTITLPAAGRRTCPRCSTALDEGPVVYRCSTCQRAVWAAELDTEHHAS